ncbi:DNA translocase FtsK [Roseixanthobacter pseudopolyaromaticivorans]|uniref:DNA translocase FtsK n=1 Tax=Xanthobacteraceae TaxID=335928 RepID=UPI00372BC901
MPSSNRPPRTYEPSFSLSARAGAALPTGRPLLPKDARDAAFSPWVALDLVPSWLRPFTLDENTRFTRTPDHFLRTRHGMGESPKVTSPPPAERTAIAPDQAAPEESGAAPVGTTAVPSVGPTWRFLVEETEPETQTANMAWSDAAEPPVALETLRAAIEGGVAFALTGLGEDAAAPVVVEGSEIALAAPEAPVPSASAEIALAPDDGAPGIEMPADPVDAATIQIESADVGLADADHLAHGLASAAAEERSEDDATEMPAALAPAEETPAPASGWVMRDPDANSDVEQESEHVATQDAAFPSDVAKDKTPEPCDPPSAPAASPVPQTLLKLGRLICLGEGLHPRAAEEQDLLPVHPPHDAQAQGISAAIAPGDEPSREAALADTLPDLALSPETEANADAAPAPLEVAAQAEPAVQVEVADLPAPASAPVTLDPLSAIVGASFHWAFHGLNFPPALGTPPLAAPQNAAPSVPVAPSSIVPVPPPSLAADAEDDFGAYELPALDLLREPPVQEPDFELSEEFLDQSSAILQQTLRDFGVRGEVIDANPGPVVTLYEFEPAPGTKSSRVIGLAADIARSMSAVSVRVAVVEGRNVIGIELPNRRRGTVWLRELLSGPHLDEAHAKLAIALGKTIGGEPVIVDLARMPHLLVAGTTGSGKSVAINTMILSLLYRHSPQACRLIMIDPKMLELSVYEGIPHLLTPVVTDPKKAIIALKWAVREMEDRYRKMSRLGVRNIDGFNARMAEARAKGEIIKRQVQVGFDKETGEALFEEQDMDLTALPFIVIIVDEMADLMLTAGKEIEGAIQRLAQMARAAGIHLVMATQRPSVDVITGTIKANFPTRISFQVTSKIDSRTILGEMGAEQLLGQGDMLYMASGGRITRVHGPFVSDGEVEKVVAHLKAQGGPEYLDAVTSEEEAEGIGEGDDAVFDKGALGEASGDLYEQAVAIVLRDRKASTSYIQRRLQVGYNKAASLMERMESEGIVGPANHAGKREILSGARPL